MIVEKPFGRDLASAQELNQVLHSAPSPRTSIFRIDHFLGKEEIRTSSTSGSRTRSSSRSGTATTSRACRSPWRRTSACRAAGAFYESRGRLRDVIENHLFQIVALLAMEPPRLPGLRRACSDGKERIFRAMRPLDPRRPRPRPVRGVSRRAGRRPRLRRRDVLRGAAATSTRGAGRVSPATSGPASTCPTTAHEVVVTLKRPPQALFEDAVDASQANYLRFRISPDAEIALSARQEDGRAVRGRAARARAQPRGRAESAVRALARRRDRGRQGPVHARTPSTPRGPSWRPILNDRPASIPYEPGSRLTSEADDLDRRRWRLAQPRPEGELMQLGMVGLGRMGAGLTERLMSDGHEVAVHDVSAAASKPLADKGAVPCRARRASSRRSMRPRRVGDGPRGRGHPRCDRGSSPMCSRPGDTIIDGGNSYYRDDMRARARARRGAGSTSSTAARAAACGASSADSAS